MSIGTFREWLRESELNEERSEYHTSEMRILNVFNEKYKKLGVSKILVNPINKIYVEISAFNKNEKLGSIKLEKYSENSSIQIAEELADSIKRDKK